MDAAALIVPTDFSCFEEKEGLPVEAFAKVQEMFNHVDWLDPVTDAAFLMLQKINASNIVPEDLNMKCRHGLEGCCSPKTIPKYQEKRKHRNRNQSSFSYDKENPPLLAQKLSPHRTMDSCPSQSMPVFTNSKQDPPALVLEGQTSSPTSTVKNLLLDHASSKSDQPTDAPIAPSSTVQDPTQTSSAETTVPTNAIISPSAPHLPPPTPQPTIVDSAVETPLQTPPSPPLQPPSLPPLTKTVSLVQEETSCHSQCSSMTLSPSESPRSPPPPPPLSPIHLAVSSTVKAPQTPPPSLMPPPPSTPPLRENPPIKAIPPPPPSPPLQSRQPTGPNPSPLVPPQAPPFSKFYGKQISSNGNSLDIPSAPPPPPLTRNSFTVPSAPPPPTQNPPALPSAPPPPTLPGKGGLKPGSPSPPPFTFPGNAKGRGLTRPLSSNSGSNKKLKPLHWLKLSRAVQGSIWAEAQKSDATKYATLQNVLFRLKTACKL